MAPKLHDSHHYLIYGWCSYMFLVSLTAALVVFMLNTSQAFAQNHTLTLPHTAALAATFEQAQLTPDESAPDEKALESQGKDSDKEAQELPAKEDNTKQEAPIASSNVKDPTAHLYVFGAGFGLMLGGSVTWKFYRKWTGEFATIDEGWFGKDTYAGGADKLGHAYTDFVFVRGIYSIYRAHNYEHMESTLYSWLFGSSLRTIMEVADGYTTYRTSYGDLAFNMIGSTLSSLLLIRAYYDILSFMIIFIQLYSSI